jgi:hypothetical protein
VGSAIFVALIAIFSTTSPFLQDTLNLLKDCTGIHQSPSSMSTAATTTTAAAAAAKQAMSKALKHATIVPRRSADRGHAEHGWLNSYHTFSFASYHSSRFQDFGSLRVLNEDRVQPQTGFPTHRHRDAEIFSYILSGELTHRDSMIKKGVEGEQGKQFYRMKRGDVQFTTGGSGEMFSFPSLHQPMLT